MNASAATRTNGAASNLDRNLGKFHRPGTTTLHANSGGTRPSLASAHPNTHFPRGAPLGYTFAKARPQKSAALKTKNSVGTNKSPKSLEFERAARDWHGGDVAPLRALHTELVTAGNTHRVTVNVSATAAR